MVYVLNIYFCFVSHLSACRWMDRTNRTCRGVVLALVPLAHDKFNRLVQNDRTERNDARQKGRSHPVACVRARTTSGKAIGHVQH